jgi:hypothetical protein
MERKKRGLHVTLPWSQPRACRDGGENLIVETSACFITARTSQTFRGQYGVAKVTLTNRILKNPLDKIFEGIPAGSVEFIHGSVTYYEKGCFISLKSAKLVCS